MKQEGGSAFPLSIVNFNDYHEPTHTSDTPGMSLRDWFAGMALNGMLSHSLPIKETISADELIVSLAYHMADLMIEERSKNV